MVRVVASMAMILAVACTGTEPAPPRGVPLSFDAFTEGFDPVPCVEGPDFLLASHESAWIDAVDQHTSCKPGDIDLPPISFGRRFGVAAWWGPGCDGGGVRTDGVDIDDGLLAVRGARTGTTQCASPSGGLESLLKVDIPPGQIERAVFVLDGQVVGEFVP